MHWFTTIWCNWYAGMGYKYYFASTCLFSVLVFVLNSSSEHPVLNTHEYLWDSDMFLYFSCTVGLLRTRTLGRSSRPSWRGVSTVLAVSGETLSWLDKGLNFGYHRNLILGPILLQVHFKPLANISEWKKMFSTLLCNLPIKWTEHKSQFFYSFIDILAQGPFSDMKNLWRAF